MSIRTRNETETKITVSASLPLIAVVIAAVLMIFITLASVRLVRAGQRGVLLHWGAVQPKVLGQGIHLMMPIRSKIVKMNVQIVKYEVEATAFSKDLQDADAIIAVNYHTLPNEVGILYDEIGKDYEVTIIAPSTQEVAKAVTAKFVAQDLIEKRQEVRDGIFDLLSTRLASKHIIVDDVSIVNFDFSEEYERAVERKQVAQQDALTAENVLRQKKIEADQRIATATGEAEAIRIQSEAIAKQGGAEYLKIRFIDKWNGILPGIITSDAASLLIQAPTNGQMK